MQKTLSVIAKNGDSENMAAELATFKVREEIIGTKNYLDIF